METYRNSDHWRAYKALLSQEFGVEISQEPEERWLERRGHRLHVDVWSAVGSERGTVILTHGGGGNGRVLAPFADILAKAGWRVLAPDLPGYGLTKPAPDFHWEYSEWPSLIAALADEQEGPVFLMGLSLGGMTVLYAAQEAQRVDGVIATTLLDPSVDAQFVAAAKTKWLGWLTLFGFRVAPWLVDRIWTPLHFAAAMCAMSANKPMARFFETDPLLGRLWVPARFFRSVRDLTRQSLDLECPFLLAHPGADAWTPAELSRHAFARIGSPKKYVCLTNGSHLPLEQPALSELSTEVLGFLAQGVVSSERKHG